jgi:nitrilase
MPEAVLGGYPKGSEFGTRVGYRTPEGREEYLAYWQQSIDLEGPEVAQLGEMARKCKTAIVLGVIERGGSTLYCTALFISDEGRLVAKHRKLMPTASERLIWGQGDGSTLSVVDCAAGRIGSAICWENYMPLFRSAMYAKGVDIWCAPTVDERDIWQASMRHIAYEGRVYLVSACQYQPSPASQGKSVDHWPDDQPLIRGGSIIVSPMGEILAGPVVGEDALISVDIDLNEIVKARYDMDPAGHYSRPDIFALNVDESGRDSACALSDQLGPTL